MSLKLKLRRCGDESIVVLQNCGGFAGAVCGGTHDGISEDGSNVGSGRIARVAEANAFYAQGFDRTYYDFYVGFGLFVAIFMVFAAVVAWGLGSLPAGTVASMPMVRWGFAICMAAITVLSWTNFFVVPVVFSGLITVCLVLAAWLA